MSEQNESNFDYTINDSDCYSHSIPDSSDNLDESNASEYLNSFSGSDSFGSSDSSESFIGGTAVVLSALFRFILQIQYI